MSTSRAVAKGNSSFIRLGFERSSIGDQQLRDENILRRTRISMYMLIAAACNLLKLQLPSLCITNSKARIQEVNACRVPIEQL
jgi:hypothetical protein